MNALSYPMDRLHAINKSGQNALSSSNEPFACDQHIGTKFMNALSSSNESFACNLTIY